jgi:hypothetical protein
MEIDAAAARNGTAFRFDMVMRPREERVGYGTRRRVSEQRFSQDHVYSTVSLCSILSAWQDHRQYQTVCAYSGVAARRSVAFSRSRGTMEASRHEAINTMANVNVRRESTRLCKGQRAVSTSQEGPTRICAHHMQARATSAHHGGAACDGLSRCPEIQTQGLARDLVQRQS